MPIYDDPAVHYDSSETYDGPFVPTPPGTWVDIGHEVTYHAYDLVDGTYLATLPFVGVTWSSLLNGAGTFSGTLPLTDPNVRALDPYTATTPGKTLIIVDLDGSVIEGFIVWPRTRKKTTKAIEIQGAGQAWSYFAQRVQATDYSVPPVSGIAGGGMALWDQAPADPTLIAAQLIEDALAYYKFGTITLSANILGGLGVLINNAIPDASAPVTPVGEWISPNYPYSSLATIDSIISQLAQMGYGASFDYGLDIQYSAGQFSPLVATVNINYPRRGRTAADNQLVVNLNQARDYEFPEDASKQGTTVYETGAPGTLFIEDNVNPVEQGWPVLEQIISRTAVNGPNAVAIIGNLAASDSYFYSFPAVAGTATVDLFGIDPQIGQFVCGDSCLVVADPDECYPAGFNDEWRIVGYQATVPEFGDATMQLTLNVPPSSDPASAPAV